MSIEDEIKEMAVIIQKQVKYHDDNRHLYGHTASEFDADEQLHKVYLSLCKQSKRIKKLNDILVEINKHNNDAKSRAGNRPH